MGMGGVQRTAKFAKYLGHFNWQPYVLTINPKVYLASDYCLLHEVENAGVKIYRTGKNGNGEKNSNGHKVVKFKNDSNRKLLSNISQTFLIPDSKIFWKSAAVELASKIITDEKIDLIYATAPPYTDFLIACELKNKFGLPLVLDYRDSWIDCPNNYYPTPLHKSKHKKMETGVLKNADKIVTINDRIKELIHLRYPFVEDEKVSVIPQGYDPDDFNNNSAAGKNNRMRITYSGSFLNYYTPKYFLDGLKKATEKNPEIKENVEACFIGTFPEEYKEYITRLGLNNTVNLVGYVEHSACTNLLSQSDVLWMMINKSSASDLHSTGKLYEYFGANKPVLACVPDGVARRSLDMHGAAILTEPEDSNAIAEAIIKFYNNFKAGTMPVPNSQVTGMYDRKRLAGKLANEFDILLKLVEVTS